MVHLHVARVAELGLLARPLAGQPRLRIGGRLVSGVAAPLAVKVHAGVAGIIRRGLPLVSFALEALVSGPRFDKRAVDGEMLVREQALRPGLLHHRVEKALRLIENATSLGGVGSTLEARARWEPTRVPPGLLRLSVGLEDVEDLWGDLAQALGG